MRKRQTKRMTREEKEDIADWIRLEWKEYEEDMRALERIKNKLRCRMFDIVKECPHLNVKDHYYFEDKICQTRKFCEDCKGYVFDK